MRVVLISALLFFLFLIGCSLSVPPNQMTGAVTSFVRDEGNISVYFCPRDGCEDLMIDFLSDAEEYTHCALYDFNLVNTSTFLEDKSQAVEVKIVVDEDNAKKTEKLAEGVGVVVDKGYGLMHNKFCVVDGAKVMTGSMNPTKRDTTTNNNNLLFVESDTVAGVYDAEFWELWNKGKNEPVGVPSVLLGDVALSVYFCPDDRCADKVIKELRKAQHSIYFMTFSFTHAGIANLLLLKKEEGVEIKGVFEKTQLNDYTMFPVLEFQGADVLIDGNKYNMHHKVFIVDNETVITGSFNPTKGGDERNDENMLVIKDKEIAGKFLEEFEMVYRAAQNLTQLRSNPNEKPKE